ncbi:hypothetical protein GF340_06080 [Candidatus Peregrinibacteria bacterium]|nr:hypothetical protein [Candidatus Peregrinibacteria bacterium]
MYYISFIYFLTGLLILIMGIFALVKNPRNSINRVFSIFALISVLWMGLLSQGYNVLPFNLDFALTLFRLSYAIAILGFYTLFLFFYLFPSKSVKLPKIFIYLMGLFSLGGAFVTAFTPLLLEQTFTDDTPDVLGPLYIVYLIYVLLCFFLASYLALKKYFNNTGTEKKKIGLAAIGFLIFVAFASITNIVLPIFDIIILQNEAGFATLIFFATLFYAVYKERFFNIAYLSLHLLRIVILFVVYLALIVSIFVLLKNHSVLNDSLTALIVASSCAFAIYLYLNLLFPQFYSNSFKHFRKNISDFEIRLFDAKKFSHLNDLIDEIFIEKLNIKKAKVYIIDHEELEEDHNIYAVDGFTKELDKVNTYLFKEDLKAKSPPIIGEKMQALNAELCFPLRSQKKVIGFFILGQKSRKRAYNKEEIEELIGVIPNLETNLMNILVTSTLQEENDLMKQIIEEKTRLLKRTNMRLKTMLKDQDNFISLTAHEFRTPLTVAKLSLDQINIVHKKDLPEKIRKDVKTASDQLRNLGQLIERLLEVRRAERAMLEIVNEKFELNQLLKIMIKGSQLLAAKKHIRIIYNESRNSKIIVCTDKIKLQEILDNLIQNAIKFSPANDTITIKLTQNKKNKSFKISIKDNGPGIPAKEIKSIFEKFKQGSRAGKGVGIGLYLVKQYIRIMKGKIDVISKEGEGATFNIELPVKAKGCNS